MTITNNFFIINGQVTRDPRSVKFETEFDLNYTSKIYPLDMNGNPIIVSNIK